MAAPGGVDLAGPGSIGSDEAIATMVMALADRRAGVLAELRAAPELLDGPVWRVFEVEGGEVGSLARADKYVRPEAGWRHALLVLAGEGRLDRDRLLDASLAALQRDFPAFRAQWFCRFHEELEPTTEERAGRADAYLRLLASPVEGTIAFAVKALGKAAPEPDALAAAIPPALASERKCTVVAALKLLERAGQGAAVAAGALQHPSAETQARALDVVEALAAGDPPRAALLEYADVVAPQVRDRWAALAGAPAAPPAPATILSPPPAVASREPLTPPRDAAELAVLVTRLLEQDPADPDELDLALHGIAAMCGSREPFDGPLKPLVPRIRRLAPRGRLIAVVLLAWLDATAPAGAPSRALQEARALEVAGRAAAAEPCELLATPTHRGGWIEAARAGEGAGPLDVAQARYRLRGGPKPPAVRVALQRFSREPFAWPVRIELEPPSLPDDPVGAVWSWQLVENRIPGLLWEDGPAGVRRLAAAWPAFHDGAAALGASLLAGHPGNDAITGGSAFLAALEDMSEAGLALLAIGLGTRDDAAGLAAVDAAAAALADGRLDPRALAPLLAGAVRHDIVPGRRLGGRLRTLAAHGHEGAVRIAIEDVPAGAGRDAHHLLELLDDLCAQTGAPVASAAARDWLAAQAGSSKTARLARSLLARG